MEISPAAKVGMITVLALIILGITFVFLRSQQDTKPLGNTYHIIFQRVEGLAQGAPVRLAGVQVGRVLSLTFTPERKVDVRVDIFPQYGNIALTHESVYTIGQSFVGERWLEISPQPGEALEKEGYANGVSPVTMDEILAKSEGTLDEIDASMEGFNKFVNDPEFQHNIKAVIGSLKNLSMAFQHTARDASHLINGLDDRLGALTGNANRMMDTITAQVNTLGSDFHGVAGTLNRVAIHSEPQIQAILANVRDASGSLKVGMNKLQAMLDNKQIGDDLQATMHSVREAADNIQGILGDVHLISSDPKVQESIKGTFSEAQQTVAEAHRMIQKINRILGRWGGGDHDVEPVKGPPQRLINMNLESEWNARTGDQSTNLNGFLLPHGFGPIPYGMQMGVDSLGNHDLFNFQVMDSKGSLRTRGGVVRSQFGVGVDDYFGDNASVSMDLYDPHLPQLDLVGRYGLKDFFLMGGVRDTLHQRNPVFGIGKQF